MESGGRKTIISEVLPKSGLVYSEKLVIYHLFKRYSVQSLCQVHIYARGGLGEILCKPKILPLKSAELEQLQKLESQAASDNENPLDREFYKG